MKKLVKLVAVLAALALVLSCDLNGGDDDNGDGDNGGVDFTDHTTDYAIRLSNLTGERLVVFKGGLTESALIGGIPAHATQFGLKKDPVLFNRTHDFPLIFLTEAQYNANKSNLQSLKNFPFTRIFAFYNATGTNDTVYEISGHLGGSNKLLIQNLSSMNVELRLNGISGETIGYAEAVSLNTTLYLDSADYNIFPVFKGYNAYRDAIITVYPKFGNGNAWYTQFQVGAENQNEYSLDVSDIPITGFSSGTALLIIENQSNIGVQLQRGGTPLRTATGIATINNGWPRTFQIDMASAGDNKYADSTGIAGYTVGPNGGQVNIGDGSNYQLYANKIYKVTVTGTYGGSGLIVSEPVEQSETITLDDIKVD
jgi:hypothetical protein